MSKYYLHRIAAGVAIVVASIWGMTSSAAECDVKETENANTVVIDFRYIEDYEPETLYALEGAETFQTADVSRKVGSLKADTKINCYQKTDNGFYYGTVDGNMTFYVSEKAVAQKPGSRKKAELLAKEVPKSQKGILFVFNSFGEIDTVTLENPETEQKVILRGMGMYDYETCDFVTTDTEKILLQKKYLDGSVIEQEFDISTAKRTVGIYDDGSLGKSWIEIDGEFIYE